MRILVVDDDIMNRTILVKLLGNLGYQPEEAESGREALRKLSLKQFDLVLMDCQMPDLDGYTTTAMVRASENNCQNPAIPIVALTADSIKGTQERCLAAGMNDYLIKPVTPELLKHTISRHVKLTAPDLH